MCSRRRRATSRALRTTSRSWSRTPPPASPPRAHRRATSSATTGCSTRTSASIPPAVTSTARARCATTCAPPCRRRAPVSWSCCAPRTPAAKRSTPSCGLSRAVASPGPLTKTREGFSNEPFSPPIHSTPHLPQQSLITGHQSHQIQTKIQSQRHLRMKLVTKQRAQPWSGHWRTSCGRRRKRSVEGGRGASCCGSSGGAPGAGCAARWSGSGWRAWRWRWRTTRRRARCRPRRGAWTRCWRRRATCTPSWPTSTRTCRRHQCARGAARRLRVRWVRRRVRCATSTTWWRSCAVTWALPPAPGPGPSPSANGSPAGIMLFDLRTGDIADFPPGCTLEYSTHQRHKTPTDILLVLFIILMPRLRTSCGIVTYRTTHRRSLLLMNH